MNTAANIEVLNNFSGAEGPGFWKSQQPNHESTQKLWKAFRKVLLYGPNRRLPGVRVHSDLASKKDNPNTPLCIIDKKTPGTSISMELSLATVWNDEYQTWHIWNLIYDYLHDSWLKKILIEKEDWWEMVLGCNISMLEHPLHFTQDWALFEEDSFAVEELSFTRFGFPSSESRKYMKNDGSATEIWTKLRQHVAQTSNSQQETIILGRSWTICPGSRTMPLSTLGFSSSQVILGHDLDIAEVAECAIVFPKRYVGPWPINTWTNWCCVGNTRLHVQFHVRYLSPQLSAITGSDPKCKYSGLRFERDGWRICGESTEYSIAEARSSIAILTSLWHQLPCYSMVTLTDTSGFLLDYVEDKISWNDTELRPCHEFAGVIIFQLAVRRLIMEWEEQWDSTLKLIMSIPRSQVVVQRRDLRSGEFEVQQRNFTIRELLFKSCDMIRELTDDLQSLKNDLDASTTVIAHNSVGENFEMLVIYQKGIESRLLGVIQRMLAEIDPLNVLDTLPPRS